MVCRKNSLFSFTSTTWINTVLRRLRHFLESLIFSTLSPRRLVSRALGIAALLLLALSAWYFRPSFSTDLLDEAFWFLLAGALVFWLALLIRDCGKDTGYRVAMGRWGQWARRLLRLIITLVRPRTPPPSNIPLTPVRSRWLSLILILLGILSLVALTEINTGLLGIADLQGVTIHVQFALLVAGIVFLLGGFSGAGFPRWPLISTNRTLSPSGLDDTQPTPVPRSNLLSLRTLHLVPRTSFFSLSTWHLALSTICILAFIVRAWELGTAVHHFIDEGNFSTAVLSLLTGSTNVRMLTPFGQITAFPWVYPYLQTGFVSILGRNLEGLRALSVIVGTMGVPALYMLARTLFDVKTALLAALLLATFPPHIQFSRIGLNNIVDPLLGTLALAFLLRGFRFNRRLDFALAGASLGLTQYFYEGGRFIYPVLVCLSLAVLVIVWPGYLRRRWRGLLIALVMAVFIALPVYITLIAHNAPLDARFQTVGIGGSYWLRVGEFSTLQTLEQHLLVPLLVYVYLPEIGLYYGGEQAMILPYLVPFFLLGATALLFYWRSPGIIILMWVLLTSVGNMLLTESAVYARYVVAFPAIVLLIALGLRSSAWLIWPHHWRVKQGIVIALVVLLAGESVRYYFVPHLERYNQQTRQTFDSEDAMFRSVGFLWGTQIYVLTASIPSQSYLSGVLNYLTDGLFVQVAAPGSVTPGFLEGLPRGVDLAFYVEPGDTLTVELLRKYFNLEGPFFSPYNLEPRRALLLYYSKYGGAPTG
jgi:4-amino-4-deoxy-L-arabinose transferase-like glycosyltransferase